MERKDVLKVVDHTLLAQTATWEEIRGVLDEGMKYETASACIPAAYVKQAAEYVEGRLPICTVIGFPNGYSTTAVKVFEAKDAVSNGAREIDMVINVGALKDRQYETVLEDIREVKKACGNALLKVIIECCLLTDEEKVKACELAQSAGADFVKTSTGFSTGGARAEDVALMRKAVGTQMGVKASGGIRDRESAEKMLAAGADRLGTSATVTICGQ